MEADFIARDGGKARREEGKNSKRRNVSYRVCLREYLHGHFFHHHNHFFHPASLICESHTQENKEKKQEKTRKEKEKEKTRKEKPTNQPTNQPQSIHPSQKHKIYDAKTFAHPPKTQAAAPNTLP